MSRPTVYEMNATALRHNLKRVKQCAPDQKIMAMVKANGYGCGALAVASVLEGHVDAFGVACLEEALVLCKGGIRTDCVLLQGVFEPSELFQALVMGCQCVVHHERGLRWILETPLPGPLTVWVKVDTGMHRLGFEWDALPDVLSALEGCPWVAKDIRVMSHLANADIPTHPANQQQWLVFSEVRALRPSFTYSMANSAAILALPKTHADWVRPGLMLYGVSPFPEKGSAEFGLVPVMRATSEITAIHHLPSHAPVGYGGTWKTDKPSVIGVVAVGYGDGYPRHIASNTPTWIRGRIAPVVGRVSMDMLTIDITDVPAVQEGDAVELWGVHVPIETIAAKAGTIPYELLCHRVSR